MFHVLEGESHPDPATADGGGLTGGGDQPGGGGGEALRLRDSPTVGPGDHGGLASLGLSLQPVETLQLGHHLVVPEPVDREGVDGIAVGGILGLCGHASRYQAAVTDPGTGA